MKATRTCPGPTCEHWEPNRGLCRWHFGLRPVETRNCANCKAEFESSNKKRIMCSPRCSAIRYQSAQKGMPPDQRRCQSCREVKSRSLFDDLTRRCVCRDCDAWRTTGVRRCRTCKIPKPIDDFHLRRAPGGRESQCKVCVSERGRVWHARPDKQRQFRNQRLMYRFGITADDYDRRLVAQGGVCPICLLPPSPGAVFHVDHDHDCCSGDKTCGNCVRDLLCFTCNVALGAIKDSIESAQRLTEYLRRHK